HRGRCFVPSCDDGFHNQDETDVDCGGSCGPCGVGRMCNLDSECTSGVCRNGRCAAPACDDGLLNGTETDVDCGGTCEPCMDNQRCKVDEDCQSQVCDNGFCAVPRCGDGKVNQESEKCDGGDFCDENCEFFGCPGTMFGNTCVWVPDTGSAASKAAARTACQALGPCWTLCTQAELCDPNVQDYLATICNCVGKASTCSCGTADNLYFHVEHTLGSETQPMYVRGPQFNGCLTGAMCTNSVSETCGTPVCCLGE